MERLLYYLTVFLILPLSADVVSDAINFRPSSVIRCSPSGNSKGALPPSKVFHILSRNQELQLLPGNYSGIIVVGKDKVAVSGDGTGKCNAALRITSKNCIVRDLWIKKLIIQNNLVVVNSVIDFVQSENKHKGSQTVVFYNCCIRKVDNHSNDTKMIFSNCTFRNGGPVFDINTKTKLVFNDSVLDSGQFVFSLLTARAKKAKIYFKNSYMYGLSGLAVDSLMRNKNVPAAYSVKELRKLVNFNYTGAGPLKKAFFDKELPPLNQSGNAYLPDMFVQSAKSSCRNAGIIPSKMLYLKKTGEETTPQPDSRTWEQELEAVKAELSEFFKE